MSDRQKSSPQTLPPDDTLFARELAALLRDRTRWPRDFHWNYMKCETCAVALAACHWLGDRDSLCSVRARMQASPELGDAFFALRRSLADAIMGRPAHVSDSPFIGGRFWVRPEDVAAKLEQDFPL